MPAGFEIYDIGGNLMFDGTERLFRFIGSVVVGNTSGSVTNAKFATGTPGYIWVGNVDPYVGWYPTISFSGTTLSWTYTTPAPGMVPAGGTIFYGVY